MFEVWKLKRRIQRIERSYAKDREELEKRKASHDDLQQLEASEFYAVRGLQKEIDQIVGLRLSHEARFLDVETPPLTDNEMWDAEFGRPCPTKGRAYVRKLIDEEKSRRFEAESRWVTKIVLPVLTLTLGIIGTITGLVAVNLNRKQMEAVSAAIVEMPRGVSVSFPVPPSGEARTNFTNSAKS